jgi:hypothetical protein
MAKGGRNAPRRMNPGRRVLESAPDPEETRRMTAPVQRPDPLQPPAPVAARDPRPHPRRHLSPADRLIRVPLGLLYLGLVALLALPVMIWMTALHAAVRAWARLAAGARGGSTRGSVNGERGA